MSFEFLYQENPALFLLFVCAIGVALNLAIALKVFKKLPMRLSAYFVDLLLLAVALDIVNKPYVEMIWYLFFGIVFIATVWLHTLIRKRVNASELPTELKRVTKMISMRKEAGDFSSFTSQENVYLDQSILLGSGFANQNAPGKLKRLGYQIVDGNRYSYTWVIRKEISFSELQEEILKTCQFVVMNNGKYGNFNIQKLAY